MTRALQAVRECIKTARQQAPAHSKINSWVYLPLLEANIEMIEQIMAENVARGYTFYAKVQGEDVLIGLIDPQGHHCKIKPYLIGLISE